MGKRGPKPTNNPKKSTDYNIFAFEYATSEVEQGALDKLRSMSPKQRTIFLAELWQWQTNQQYQRSLES